MHKGRRALRRAALIAAAAVRLGQEFSRLKQQIVRGTRRKQREDVVTMKKSVLIAVVAALAAAAGALVTVAVYLRRREKELDEYERLLFSEDFDGEDDAEAAEEEPEAQQEDPAPEADAE